MRPNYFSSKYNWAVGPPNLVVPLFMQQKCPGGLSAYWLRERPWSSNQAKQMHVAIRLDPWMHHACDEGTITKKMHACSISFMHPNRALSLTPCSVMQLCTKNIHTDNRDPYHSWDEILSVEFLFTQLTPTKRTLNIWWRRNSIAGYCWEENCRG